MFIQHKNVIIQRGSRLVALEFQDEDLCGHVCFVAITVASIPIGARVVRSCVAKIKRVWARTSVLEFICFFYTVICSALPAPSDCSGPVAAGLAKASPWMFFSGLAGP